MISDLRKKCRVLRFASREILSHDRGKFLCSGFGEKSVQPVICGFNRDAKPTRYFFRGTGTEYIAQRERCIGVHVKPLLGSIHGVNLMSKMAT